MRGIAGLLLCVLAVKLLEIFDVEAKQQLEALDRARAIAEERARFRRDLHDGTIQSIYAAGPAPGGDRDPLRRPGLPRTRCARWSATSTTRPTASATTSAPWRNRPSTPQGIASALSELARRFSEETGRDVRFGVEGQASAGPLPDEAGQHLSQILREALTNTARHAGACRVQVSADLRARRARPDRHRRRVRPVAPRRRRVPGQHEGLRNMRERARRLGGRLAVEEAPGAARA